MSGTGPLVNTDVYYFFPSLLKGGSPGSSLAFARCWLVLCYDGSKEVILQTLTLLILDLVA